MCTRITIAAISAEKFLRISLSAPWPPAEAPMTIRFAMQRLCLSPLVGLACPWRWSRSSEVNVAFRKCNFLHGPSVVETRFYRPHASRSALSMLRSVLPTPLWLAARLREAAHDARHAAVTKFTLTLNPGHWPKSRWCHTAPGSGSESVLHSKRLLIVPPELGCPDLPRLARTIERQKRV